MNAAVTQPSLKVESMRVLDKKSQVDRAQMTTTKEKKKKKKKLTDY